MAKRKMNKAALAVAIRESKDFTDEQKSELLQLLNEKKRYGLVWEDHPEDAETLLKTHIPVFVEDESKRIVADAAKVPDHILIEGDNLHALTALTYTHENRIDVIYIDPPYNTGNKDFVYNDSFVDAEDGFRHSKWLSFMEKRLRIAKKLLSDKGVIFISIDDNEQANLKLLCDEVFGCNNFVAKFDWRKKTGANDAKDISVVTESILLYTKNHAFSLEKNIWNRDVNSINKNRYKLTDKYVETRGKYYLDNLDRGGLQYSDSMNFGIKAPDNGIIFPNGRSQYKNDGWIWKWGIEKVAWGIENGFLEFVKSTKSKDSAYTIKYKVYELVDNEGNLRTKFGRAYSNLILEPINQQGNSEMTELFNGTCPFSNPKPIGLIKYLFSIIKTPNIILDFFAGSGTTLHATMQLNEEDGGHRQCILVTNNENNICEEVTYERNKRVIQGYTTPKGVNVEGLRHNNLRYYKTGFVSRDNHFSCRRRLMLQCTDLLCIKEGLYPERLFTIGGKRIKKEFLRFFSEDDKDMLIVYDERLVAPVVGELRARKPTRQIKIYVYSDGQYAYDDEFQGLNVELCALPDAICQSLKSVMPEPDAQYFEENPDGMEEKGDTP